MKGSLSKNLFIKKWKLQLSSKKPQKMKSRGGETPFSKEKKMTKKIFFVVCKNRVVLRCDMTLGAGNQLFLHRWQRIFMSHVAVGHFSWIGHKQRTLKKNNKKISGFAEQYNKLTTDLTLLVTSTTSVNRERI